MNCPRGQEALRAILAAGDAAAISPEEIDEMLRHADECPQCSAALRDLAARAILAQSPLVQMDPARSARVRARVLARAAGARSVPDRRVARAGSWRGSGVSGWLAAAALFVALLTHHGFHQPLSSGWLVAAGFAAVALALGVYALAQKRYAADLKQQINARDPALSGDERAP